MASRVKNEVRVHKRLNHPNILKLYHFFEDDKCVYLIMELCENGELFSFIRTCKQNGGLEEDVARMLFADVINGIVYLHEEVQIIHRDIKLSNILLNGLLCAKIGDFGLAISSAKLEHSEQKTICGTPNYLAPYHKN